ncbi:uncharacterized protein [Eurosta solidaginis]|uniref:uncharacterized protein n=1 Tax=Eurosta solidaginis TaxID=178769 RepID=UPI0035308E77
MTSKTCEMRLHIVDTPLNLPLFMAGRTRFRRDQDQFQKLPSYIFKKKTFFTKHCSETKEIETRTEKDLKQLVGIYPPTPERCVNLRVTKLSRDLSEDKPWHLGPATYGILNDPFASKRGNLGSYWRKRRRVERKDRAKENATKGHWKFYDLPSGIEHLLGPLHRHKGVFLTNARDRKATARCMVSEPTTAYHNPADPSPAHYDPKIHEIANNVSQRKKQEPPNPHIFLPHTSVPDKCLPLIRRHTSFEPAVGRYETRIIKHCPCAQKIITVGLNFAIDREKRRKFRRLPYKKIKSHIHCYPDWDHVVGKGHCHLFRIPGVKPNKRMRAARIDLAGKTVNLYPDSKYINMINSPRREGISLRRTIAKLRRRTIRIRFNCITKRVIRRQLRINKKIVFNSGSERFPELDYRPVILNATQLEELKNRLPPERQLRDHPIMRKKASQISSHLLEAPEHMRPAYVPTLRKRFFKFLPLPGPKVLITEQELRPGSICDPEKEFFYNKPVNAERFFKGSRPLEFKQDGGESEIASNVALAVSEV